MHHKKVTFYFYLVIIVTVRKTLAKMAAHLQFHEFKSDGVDDIESHLYKREQHFIALDLDGNAEAKAKKQKGILLSRIGAESYKHLKELCYPDLPSVKTLVKIKTELNNCYVPKCIVFGEKRISDTRCRQWAKVSLI